MSESEDRTEAPSKLKHQQARERGQVAQSPELTSAAALLAASLTLGLLGPSIASNLIETVRSPWSVPLPVGLGLDELTQRVRSAIGVVLGPLALLTLAVVGAGAGAHAAQVGFLWSPAILTPQVGRLWAMGEGRGLAARAGRGLWTIGKTTAVLAVAAWSIGSRLREVASPDRLDLPGLALAWTDAVRGMLLSMSLAALGLGLLDLTLQKRRFSRMLQLTPDEAREDRKATDGDPALKSRRAKLAKAWRGESPELLVGATLLVVGDRDLAVVVGGGPPPGRRVNVRSAADGATGRALRKAAKAAGLAIVEGGPIAMGLARALNDPAGQPSAEALAGLASIWPTAE